MRLTPLMECAFFFQYQLARLYAKGRMKSTPTPIVKNGIFFKAELVYSTPA